MKVAVLSESSADEAAIRVLVDALLSQEAEAPSSMPPIRKRGWPAVRNVLPAILKALHYQSDSDGLVVVVDSDLSQVHQANHTAQGQRAPKCRLCELRAVARDVLRATCALGKGEGHSR